MHKSKHHLAPADDENRNQYQTFRLTVGEAGELVGHAVAAGISVSELVRRRVLGHAAPVAAAPALNREAYAQLARSASNLNQLTHHLNMAQVAGQSEAIELATVRALLEKLLFEVSKLRAELLGAGEK